jgi:uncharacterized glyoxalase superfamily protein PhnB
MQMTKAIPDGYTEVTPYLVVEDAGQVLDFAAKAFGAMEIVRMAAPDGKVAHAEFRIGGATVMTGSGGGENPLMPGMIYLYVEDADATYRRALDAGATSLEEPNDTFYGDRRAAVQDRQGNSWYIATHVEDVPEEEMQRRAQEMMQASG